TAASRSDDLAGEYVRGEARQVERRMPRFFSNLLRVLRNRRGSDMLFLCRHLLSSRGEASQTALAAEIINVYRNMNSAQRLRFFEMLSQKFSPDTGAILRAAAEYERAPGTETLAAL